MLHCAVILAGAVVGGILTFYAARIGLAGVVIDGAIRDVAEIRQRDFPVYARGVTHRGPYKDGPGEINVPVQVGGMVVNPGDVIVGDAEADAGKGRISISSPIARAMIGKEEGDSVTVQTPGGTKNYEIVQVQYL